MKRSAFLLVAVIAAIMLLANIWGCAKVPVRETSPQYVGLSKVPKEAESQNTIIKVVIPTPGSKDKDLVRDQESSVPVIRSAYAIDRARYGSVIKIYIEAEDSAGAMAKILTNVDLAGLGHFPNDIITLGPQYGKYFKGYLQWNTFSSMAPYIEDGTTMYVKIVVIDKTGRTSNAFEFPFTFETGVGPAPNPPAPFNQGDLPKLGNISIELTNPRLKWN